MTPSRGGRTQSAHGASRALRALCLATLAGLASGSHFRYGTMNWEAVGDLSGTTATVDIELEIGYRRTYTWGREKLESWQQASKGAPYATNNFKSCDDKTVGTYQEGTNDDGNRYCGSDTGGTTNDPQHDYSAEESENALDTNDNGVYGETFYMKLPAYDGDYDASTESGVVVECPDAYFCDYYKPNCTAADYNFDNTTQFPWHGTAQRPECAQDECCIPQLDRAHPTAGGRPRVAYGPRWTPWIKRRRMQKSSRNA